MVASENSPANKNMFKIDAKKDTKTVSVNVIPIFTSVMESVLNKA